MPLTSSGDAASGTLRSVAGIAFNGDKLFIARRESGGAMGGRWEFPGGKVEKGESDTAALLREFQEELGISVGVGEHLGSASFEHKGGTRLLNAYEVFFPKMEFTLFVHHEWKWASLDEIETLDFAGSDLKLLPGLRSRLGNSKGKH
ncbi:MAG: (deoxy)nucleoside triphosphate pyrophosphohydrolase [Spirochaetaceae bacterium]|jgi:8-oxo-dGTP diphosphatase|nr:(deoxy)nucleoside triphosphate pyrophosphohydrolase [Spirochaetaceae bacterium]